MVTQSASAERTTAPSRRMARRILQEEAYRRILAGDIPDTLSEFAARLSAWFKHAYPAAPAVPGPSVEGAIRDTWHRRHEVVGTEL